MKKRSDRGSVLVEFLLLASLGLISTAFLGKEFACGIIHILTRIPLPFAGNSPNTAIALCQSTEALGFTGATAAFIFVGLVTFMRLKNHLSRRRG